MDPLTIGSLLIGALAGGGVVWLVMDRRRLAERNTDLRTQLDDKSATAADLGRQLGDAQHKAEQLQAQADELRRTAWPGNLNLDQRAWASSITNLVALAASDQLDALMRLNPEAARAVVEKIAPHLFTKENIR